MGLLVTEQKRRALLHSMAELARRTAGSGNSLASTNGGGGGTRTDDRQSGKNEAAGESYPTIFPMATATPMAPPMCCYPPAPASETAPSATSPIEGDRGVSQASPPSLRSLLSVSTSVPNLTAIENEDAICGRRSTDPGNAPAPTSPTSDTSTDESIMFAVALLRRLQQSAEASAQGEAQVKRDEVDQILQGFSKALESVSTAWDERRVRWWT